MIKETFIIRTEWWDSISELDEKRQSEIFRLLFLYHLGKPIENLNNLSVKLVWKLIEPNLKRNIISYDKRIETSKENGKLGGRPRNLNKPNKPNVTLSDSVSVSVSDSVNDSDNLSLSYKKEGLDFGDEMPTLTEFLVYARTLEPYKITLEYSLKAKYNSWVADGWVTGRGHKVTQSNWMAYLENTISKLQPIEQSAEVVKTSFRNDT